MFQPDLSNLSHQDNNRQLTEISPSLRRTVDVLESWSADVMRSGSHQPRRLPSISNQSSPVNPSNLALSFPSHLVNIQVSPRGRIGPSHGNTFHEPISRIFAFPHRKDELCAYEEYIDQKFTTCRTSYHSLVIRFEKAVRKRIGSRRDLELSDFEES
jgi:hypothetical protein